MEEFFILAELPLESHVGEDDGSALASKGESLLELHVFLLHEEGYYTTGASGHSSIAVN